MAQNFDITSAVAAVTVGPTSGMRSEVPFTVKNVTSRRLRVGARVRVAAQAQEIWFRIAGEAERDLGVGEVTQYVVQVEVPAATPEATARFHLQIFAVDEPSEVYTDGPTVTLAVGASAAREAPPRRRFPWWIPAAAVVVLVVGGVIAGLSFWGPREVPDVTGKDYEAAEKHLATWKLAANREDDVASTPKEVGKVLRQDPPAGQSRRPGAEVVVFVGVAPTLPSGLVGKAVAEAEQAITGARLKAAQEGGPAKSPDEVGKVIEVRPPAGQLSPGGTVTLVVGVEPTVPNVVGKTIVEAEQELKARGLSADRRNALAADQVIRQTPASDKKVSPKSVVTLFVAAPQPAAPQPVEVPYLVGMPRADAESYLTNRSLVARVTEEESATFEKGKVIRHSPGVGTRLTPQSPVTLIVAVPKSCEATTRQATEGNGAFVEFSLRAKKHGEYENWSSGTHTEYEFPTCRRINWSSIQFTCNNGLWVASPANAYSSDALCHGNTGDTQERMRAGVRR